MSDSKQILTFTVVGVLHALHLGLQLLLDILGTLLHLLQDA